MSGNHLRSSIVLFALSFAASLPAQQSFTLDQILGAPYLNELTASKTGQRLVWSENLRGRWNVWAAEGPAFAARQLTNYNQDDGGELSELQFTSDGDAIVWTVDLVARLRARGVHIEQLIFPDEVHDFLLYSNWLRALQANSDFFDRQFSWPQK